jgi:hypothetical protein
MIGTVGAALGTLSPVHPFSAMAVGAISNAMKKTVVKTNRLNEIMITP